MGISGGYPVGVYLLVFLPRWPRITAMSLLITQSQWCGYRVNSLPVDFILDIWPTPQFPKGDEANQIANTWVSIRHHRGRGLLLLGCDVVADPDDLMEMNAAVERAPADIHTGLVKLWPASTGRDRWMWSHRGGTLGSPTVLDDETAPVSYVSLGFLWCPARLLDLSAPVMGAWQHGEADVRLSEVALGAGIPMHAVPGCRPKHLHFQKEHDGDHIRQQASIRDSR